MPGTYQENKMIVTSHRKRMHPDIEFVTNKGEHAKLTFEREYKAYIYDVHNGWIDIGHGSLIPEPLIEYIKKHF